MSEKIIQLTNLLVLIIISCSYFSYGNLEGKEGHHLNGESKEKRQIGKRLQYLMRRVCENMTIHDTLMVNVQVMEQIEICKEIDAPKMNGSNESPHLQCKEEAFKDMDKNDYFVQMFCHARFSHRKSSPKIRTYWRCFGRKLEDEVNLNVENIERMKEASVCFSKVLGIKDENELNDLIKAEHTSYKWNLNHQLFKGFSFLCRNWFQNRTNYIPSDQTFEDINKCYESIPYLYSIINQQTDNKHCFENRYKKLHNTAGIGYAFKDELGNITRKEFNEKHVQLFDQLLKCQLDALKLNEKQMEVWNAKTHH